MTIRKYEGYVRTNKVGSECRFEFEVDDEDLPEDPGERKQAIKETALEALWESSSVNWGYEEVDPPIDSE